jgi:hypothetical protein
VVGANEPMPSVSKKFVTKPMARCSTPGFAGALADRARSMRTQRHPTNAAITARTASKRCAVVTPRLASNRGSRFERVCQNSLHRLELASVERQARPTHHISAAPDFRLHPLDELNELRNGIETQ